MKDTALIVFLKNNIPGKVKTRLAATMGEESALGIYSELVSLTMGEVERVPFDVFLFYSDFIPKEKISENFQIRTQKGHDLGERMKNSFDEVFELGYQKVMIIGTDCPFLTSKILLKAASYLDHCDLVIGPAEDGGYYLLGKKSFQENLFKRITWSTNAVIKETIQIADKLNLKYQFLERLSDIDNEDDWRNYLTIKQKNL